MEYKLNSYSKIIELKALMTRVAKGEITMEEAGFPAKSKKVAPEAPVDEIEGKEVIESINSDKGIEQRDKARGKLSDEKPKTQKRKLNAKGGKK